MTIPQSIWFGIISSEAASEQLSASKAEQLKEETSFKGEKGESQKNQFHGFQEHFFRSYAFVPVDLFLMLNH
jgi:hypothetical protein